MNDSNTYQTNMEPKSGDRVKFKRDELSTAKTYVVTSTQMGRLGNKIGVVPENDQDGVGEREYYYYCFVKD